jgi:SAM-dependent methyltransferase
VNDNTAQFEFWNGPVGERWAGRQDAVDYTLQHINAALMAFAAPAAGSRVLDIGCGGGTTTLALAKAAAPGRVTGLDISAPMIESAKARAAGTGLPVEFFQADAAFHAFEPEYDLAFSRLGVMFFADPASAFANIRKALKPGGRLAFLCWRAYAENPWMQQTFEAAADLLPPQEPSVPNAPGPFGLADGARTEAILAKAGFRDIAVKPLDTVSQLGATLDAAVYEALQLGPLARAARDLDDETRRKIRDRIRPALAKFETPGGVTPPAACWLVGARA